MRLKRSATIVGTALLIGGFGSAAMAAGTLSQTVISDTAPLSQVTVNFSGLNPADSIVFIQQCWLDGNAPGVVFSAANDCNQSIGTNASLASGGAGSKVLNVFNGDDPNAGEFGCGPLTSVGIPSPANGVCYVRLAPGTKSNTSTDEFIPFTYGPVVPPVVPEVPLNILLPASAAVVLGAGFVIARKRQLKSTAA